MKYRQFTPAPQVAQFVECYWTLDDSAPAPAAVQRVVPDGTCELVVNRGRPFEQFVDGEWRLQPSAFLAGQITGPLLLRPSGAASVIGIRFRPHGAQHLFRTRMDELTGTMCPLADLSPLLSREFDRVVESDSMDPVTINRALLQHDRGAQPDSLLAEAVRRMIACGGVLELARLAGQLGISLRQFERRFRAAAGISPKLFCRMQRFQRVFQAIERGTPNWVSVALDCGYFDQAHLIRDFRAFAGKPPSVFFAADDLARHFLRYAGGMSDFSKTPAAISA